MMRATRNALLILMLPLIASCAWLTEQPLPRTNPSDENAAVYYFRAIPQDEPADQYQDVRLVWRWSAESPQNPGRIRILRKQTGYPSSVSDGGAELVYSSSNNSNDFIISHATIQTGNTWYYTLFYEIDGFDEVYELKSQPTVFEENTYVVPVVFSAAFGYDGSSYGRTVWEFTDTLPTPQPFPVSNISAPLNRSYGLFVPFFLLLPGLNVDVVNATLVYDSDNAALLTFNRFVKQAPEDQSNQYYYSLLNSDSSYWTSSGEVSASVGTGTGLNLVGFETITIDSLDTLEIYGIRVAADPLESANFTPVAISVSYIGPPAP